MVNASLLFPSFNLFIKTSLQHDAWFNCANLMNQAPTMCSFSLAGHLSSSNLGALKWLVNLHPKRGQLFGRMCYSSASSKVVAWTSASIRNPLQRGHESPSQPIPDDKPKAARCWDKGTGRLNQALKSLFLRQTQRQINLRAERDRGGGMQSGRDVLPIPPPYKWYEHKQAALFF